MVLKIVPDPISFRWRRINSYLTPFVKGKAMEKFFRKQQAERRDR